MNKRILTILIVGYLVVVLATAAVLIHVYMGQSLMFESAHDRQPGVLVMMMLAGAVGFFFLFLLAGMGVYVHADAKRRGMNPWLWTAVAVFVPYFIGLVVYLHERKKFQLSCPACAARMAEDAAFCPQCGHALKRQCPACKALLAEEYRFCPHCGAAVDGK